ncbi:hypothetical protein LZM42_00520 [Pseudomonas aeruginosa]|nr:hypothetical protein [Pseudomonas aeruginosa]
MSEVCAKHVKTPAFIYGACIGCELEGLRAETQALREEVAELRARVVVAPDLLTNGDSISRMLREIGYAGDVSYHHAREIWNACLDELARINGLTVSEGLLRRVCAEPPATCCMDDEMTWRRDLDSALLELRALLSEQA